LNLRPSGYEPADRALPYSPLLPCSTAELLKLVTFVTSRFVFYLAMREITAPFTAQRAMQNDIPRFVNDARRKRAPRAALMSGVPI
jgi:hypothetical protein